MDGKLWNGSEEDGGVRSECGEHEGTDCEGGDSDSNCDVVCIKCMKLTLWRLTAPIVVVPHR